MNPAEFPCQPLHFRPVIKRTIWGGRRLHNVLDKPSADMADAAESWEIVDHGDDQSIVAEGPLTGTTLASLFQNHSRWLMGNRWEEREKTSSTQSPTFPLLLKYLDCNRVLSVQVHPDDRYAAQMTPPDLGKTEAWYVVEAEPESVIYAGLRPGNDRAALAEAVAAGQTEQLLHQFHPQQGDVVFIPAGTIHALGAGLLIAEIQQSSDSTFRLFDWNRTDAEGKSRPLHVQASLEVTDYDRGPVSALRADPLATGWQNLVDCQKFRFRCLAGGIDSVAGDDQFHILTVPRGTVTLNFSGTQRILRTGQSVLLPAAMPKCRVQPAEGGVLLGMSLPE